MSEHKTHKKNPRFDNDEYWRRKSMGLRGFRPGTDKEKAKEYRKLQRRAREKALNKLIAKSKGGKK